MKKINLFILPFILLVSCNNITNTSENTFTLTDLQNREVTLTKTSKNRVLCIGAGALRLYSYIGDVNNLVGCEDIDRNIDKNIFKSVSRPYYDVNVDVFSTLKSCGTGGPQAQIIETEKILDCNPSLIISEYEDIEKVNKLQNDTSIPCLIVKYGSDSVFDTNIKNSLTLLGKALDREEKASKLISYINSCKEELQNNSKDIKEEDKESIYIGCLGNWGRQDIYSTSSSFPLFNVSNIKNAVDSIQLTEGKLEEEKFLSLNPDKIVLDSAGLDNFITTYKTDKSKFNSVDAFKNGEIYLEMPFNAYYTNLEIALMDAYFLASIAYKDIYKDYNLLAKYDEISNAFLSQDCYDIIKNAEKSYGGFQQISNFEEFINGK